ncbi:MAG TPA: UDP-N-acetylglucosamine 2-epimerase (non-hydrolyzing) [Nitrososphaerales archaeon]|nr:UDP-N-acetylglucosamine 2-epimerase (non-hydrolyzing) [Nitrososphaerales archaeon]
MKVSIILGTRPQIIKSAPVYAAFRKRGVECEILNTGQHYDYEMNRQFFSELELPDPAADLNVGPGAPSQQVAAIIAGLGGLFEKTIPEIALVPGDTNSALAAGIACVKSGVPVAHLESGCRSGDYRMAEEINRRLLDHMSRVLLCPTSRCVSNVKREHVLAESVVNVGDTMYDSLLVLAPRATAPDSVSKLGLERGGYVFMTLHRAETVDDPVALRRVMGAVGTLPLPVAFSVHPRTRARLKEFGVSPHPNVKLLEPLPYIETLGMVSESKLVITDSGGLQKEAFWLGKPTLIARDTTEWGEIVSTGAAILVGTDPKRIERGYEWSRNVGAAKFRSAGRLFGKGNASANVADAVEGYLKKPGRD